MKHSLRLCCVKCPCLPHAALFVAAAGIALLGCTATYPTQPDAVGTVLEIHYLSPTPVSVPVASHIALSAWTVSPHGAYEDVTTRASWQTSDASVATVRVDGRFYAQVAMGTLEQREARITASYGGATDAIQVRTAARVTTFPALTIVTTGGHPLVVPTPGLIPAALGRFSVRAVLRTSAAAAIDVGAQWTSSRPEVAAYVPGQVNALQPGTTLLTASHSGVSAATWISVAPLDRIYRP